VVTLNQTMKSLGVFLVAGKGLTIADRVFCRKGVTHLLVLNALHWRRRGKGSPLYESLLSENSFSSVLLSPMSVNGKIIC
jgi:hypothetical protein